MIERILPPCAAVVEARGEEFDIRLFPEEERALGRAVEKRRREFVTARACARAALAQLGLPAQPIAKGERGEPLWPAGVVGSITHCHGYRACAIARSSDLLTLGIDAEPNAPLPPNLLTDVACEQEIASLRRLRRTRPDVHWDRLLFSAKESLYKAWFPVARRWLGFEDAVLAIDPDTGSFVARLLVFDAPLRGATLDGATPEGVTLDSVTGRWLACDGIVVTAIAVSPS